VWTLDGLYMNFVESMGSPWKPVGDCKVQCQWKNKSGRPGMSLVYLTLSVQTCNGHTGQGASPYRLVSIAGAVQEQSIAYQSMMMAICISNIIHRKSKTLVSKAMNLSW